MGRAQRESIMRKEAALPETPRDRRERAALEEDFRSMPMASAPIVLRLRNFHPSADAYLAASRGPAPYMLRLHEIEVRTAEHEAACRTAWRDLALECAGDDESFERRWVNRAASFVFDDVNDLADRHNLWYPVEARLPMDPRTGDFVPVNGRCYRLEHLDPEWVLHRFPPDLGEALSPYG